VCLGVLAHYVNDGLRDCFRSRDFTGSTLYPSDAHDALDEVALQLLKREVEDRGLYYVIGTSGRDPAILGLEHCPPQRGICLGSKRLSEPRKRRHIMHLVERDGPGLWHPVNVWDLDWGTV